MRGILPGMLWMPQDRPYSDQTIGITWSYQAGKRFRRSGRSTAGKPKARRSRSTSPVRGGPAMSQDGETAATGSATGHRSPGDVRDAQTAQQSIDIRPPIASPSQASTKPPTAISA